MDVEVDRLGVGRELHLRDQVLGVARPEGDRGGAAGGVRERRRPAVVVLEEEETNNVFGGEIGVRNESRGDS